MLSKHAFKEADDLCREAKYILAAEKGEIKKKLNLKDLEYLTSDELKSVVAKRGFNTLVFTLYPNAFAHCPRLGEPPTYPCKSPYMSESMLNDVDDGKLCHAISTKMIGVKPPLYHSGCIIGEVKDFRQDQHTTGCKTTYLLLKPSDQSIGHDACRSTQPLQIESLGVLAANPSLCLDPRPSVGIAAQKLLRNKQMNNVTLTKIVKRQNLSKSATSWPEMLKTKNPHYSVECLSRFLEYKKKALAVYYTRKANAAKDSSSFRFEGWKMDVVNTLNPIEILARNSKYIPATFPLVEQYIVDWEEEFHVLINILVYSETPISEPVMIRVKWQTKDEDKFEICENFDHDSITFAREFYVDYINALGETNKMKKVLCFTSEIAYDGFYCTSVKWNGKRLLPLGDDWCPLTDEDVSSMLKETIDTHTFLLDAEISMVNKTVMLSSSAGSGISGSVHATKTEEHEEQQVPQEEGNSSEERNTGSTSDVQDERKERYRKLVNIWKRVRHVQVEEIAMPKRRIVAAKASVEARRNGVRAITGVSAGHQFIGNIIPLQFPETVSLKSDNLPTISPVADPSLDTSSVRGISPGDCTLVAPRLSHAGRDMSNILELSDNQMTMNTFTVLQSTPGNIVTTDSVTSTVSSGVCMSSSAATVVTSSMVVGSNGVTRAGPPQSLTTSNVTRNTIITSSSTSGISSVSQSPSPSNGVTRDSVITKSGVPLKVSPPVSSSSTMVTRSATRKNSVAAPPVSTSSSASTVSQPLRSTNIIIPTVSVDSSTFLPSWSVLSSIVSAMSTNSSVSTTSKSSSSVGVTASVASTIPTTSLAVSRLSSATMTVPAVSPATVPSMFRSPSTNKNDPHIPGVFTGNGISSSSSFPQALPSKRVVTTGRLVTNESTVSSTPSMSPPSSGQSSLSGGNRMVVSSAQSPPSSLPPHSVVRSSVITSTSTKLTTQSHASTKRSTPTCSSYQPHVSTKRSTPTYSSYQSRSSTKRSTPAKLPVSNVSSSPRSPFLPNLITQDTLNARNGSAWRGSLEHVSSVNVSRDSVVVSNKYTIPKVRPAQQPYSLAGAGHGSVIADNTAGLNVSAVKKSSFSTSVTASSPVIINIPMTAVSSMLQPQFSSSIVTHNSTVTGTSAIVASSMPHLSSSVNVTRCSVVVTNPIAFNIPPRPLQPQSSPTSVIVHAPAAGNRSRLSNVSLASHSLTNTAPYNSVPVNNFGQREVSSSSSSTIVSRCPVIVPNPAVLSASSIMLQTLPFPTNFVPHSLEVSSSTVPRVSLTTQTSSFPFDVTRNTVIANSPAVASTSRGTQQSSVNVAMHGIPVPVISAPVHRTPERKIAPKISPTPVRHLVPIKRAATSPPSSPPLPPQQPPPTSSQPRYHVVDTIYLSDDDDD